MHPIIDLYSSAYMTATGMKADKRDHIGREFLELDRERPVGMPFFARIKRNLSNMVSRFDKHDLKPKPVALQSRRFN